MARTGAVLVWSIALTYACTCTHVISVTEYPVLSLGSRHLLAPPLVISLPSVQRISAWKTCYECLNQSWTEACRYACQVLRTQAQVASLHAQLAFNRLPAQSSHYPACSSLRPVFSLASQWDFDAVVVCNGHFYEPRLPDHLLKAGLQEGFPGLQMHSHSYRSNEQFAGQVRRRREASMVCVMCRGRDGWLSKGHSRPLGTEGCAQWRLPGRCSRRQAKRHDGRGTVYLLALLHIL